MQNMCYYCGKIIPEGRMICWACQYKYSGIKPECKWFHGSGYCLLKLEDCTPLPCKWYEKDPNKKEEDDNE